MSRSHPIISITGSSGAGTTSVKKTFEHIFRREKVSAAYIEGDAFHRYNRVEMRTKMAEEGERGNKHFSHFSPETNLFEELDQAEEAFAELLDARCVLGNATRLDSGGAGLQASLDGPT